VEDLLVVGGHASGEDAVVDLEEDAVVDLEEDADATTDGGGEQPVSAPAAAAPVAPAPDASAGPGKPARSEPQQTSIRVDLAKLDELMNLVGELIIAENMVTRNEDLEGLELENFQRSASHLNQITRGLQDLAMSVRMVPLRSTFRKMLRVVRDVARKRGKPADLELVGEDTEVDRTVIEAIGDPLVHLIRNAVDHGLEDAAGRAAAGKPAKGQLRLEARHEAGEVWVELSDDGKGLDRDRILARGVERGLVPAGADLSDAEVWDLIFQPGFSTAEAITDVSGRGVGMDVVRRNIMDLQGRIDVESRPGRGTTFTLCIPLTLAIIDGMLARIGDRIYTVPLFNVREIIRPEKSDLRRLPGGGEVVLVRGAPLPILSLRDKHGIAGSPPADRPAVLLVVENGGFAVALPVDSLLGQQQTVIKPLPDYLGSMPGIAGCSLMGNGTISLILDVKGLVQEVRSGADRRRRAGSGSSAGGRSADSTPPGGAAALPTS
jgi:two-component system chemotaxis sensor kinase CheA